MNVDFSYSGGHGTTYKVGETTLRGAIEKALSMARPRNPSSIKSVRVWVNGSPVSEKEFDAFKLQATDFVKVMEGGGRSEESESKRLRGWSRFKFFLCWPWESLIAGFGFKPAKKDAPTLSAALGGTLQVLILFAVIDKEWFILAGLVIGYYLLSRHIRKVAARA